MTDRRGVVIAGAGLAGAKAVEALRDKGFDGTITVVGDESHPPYERPPLSKGFLQGSSPRDKVFVHPAGWYAEHEVELILGDRVASLDRTSRRVVLADGQRLPYDKLLLTTGSRPRRLDLPGADLPGVHYLRRLEDSEALKTAFTTTARLAVVGGGWIGLEAAAAARAAGLEVTVLEYLDLPLLRVLGPEVALVYANLHEAHGVQLQGGVSVSGLVEVAGQVGGVRLGNGRTVEADLVVVGVGVLPNVDLAEGAGLAVDNGIVVDEYLRTADPDVLAAGDVANAFHPRLHRAVRVEHWANAVHQGPAAAASMLGDDAPYDRLPYFYSDQYDSGMEYIGHIGPDGYDQVVFRGEPDSGQYLAFWLADGRVQAGMNVNIWEVNETIGDLVRSGRIVDARRLADDQVPLAEV